MGQISVISGSLVKVPVDAIATLVNKSGQWGGKVDDAIYDVAGDIYHDQLDHVRLATGLSDQQVVLVQGSRQHHRGGFNDIVFVIDQRIVPLHILVEKAIEASIRAGHASLALPLMRTGVMLGKVERTVDDVLAEMKLGIDKFRQSSINITVVVYNDPALAAKFDHMFRA